MSLADKLVSSFLAFELDINVQSPVHNIRTEAIKEFEKLGFPNTKKCIKRRLYCFFKKEKCTRI